MLIGQRFMGCMSEMQKEVNYYLLPTSNGILKRGDACPDYQFVLDYLFKIARLATASVMESAVNPPCLLSTAEPSEGTMQFHFYKLPNFSGCMFFFQQFLTEFA